MKSTNVSILLTALALSNAAPAAEFEYPELAVAPRASERVESEAARESSDRWVHAAIEAPAAMSILSGLVLAANGTDDDPTKSWPKYAPWAGIGVGAAWIGLTELALKRNPPYSTAAHDLATMPKKTTREQLVRERYAEEALENAASIARKMKYFSFLTNAGAGVFMAAAAKDRSFGRVFAIASVATAFTPLLFAHTWEKTADAQKDYKKRIYGPVAGVSLLPRNSRGDVAPGLVLAFRW
ncbi:MAG: hypothetical protein JST04_04945 [Bdellovibrionales bacterium]|nr:hypothetical protein [Bdellovibrionales bacterium]